MTRTTRWRLAALGVLAFAASGLGQQTKKAKKVDVSLVFLTHNAVFEVSTDANSLVQWVKPIISGLELQFQKESERRTVVVQVTLRPEGNADVAIAGAPGLAMNDLAPLKAIVSAVKAPNSKIVDSAFRIVAKINGGAPEEQSELTPRIETPDEHRLSQFKAAETAERLASMRRWAREEALPLLAAFAGSAAPKFEGVRNLGKAIGGLDPTKPADIPALTDHNLDYWRAMMEMGHGIPLVTATSVTLHVANGEIDWARRIAQAIAPFDAGKSGPSYLLAQFRTMYDLFYKDVEAQISEGIPRHDQGKFEDALKIYDSVLEAYPKSAWARYERFQTRRGLAMKQQKSLEEVNQGWPEAYTEILACDPLYPESALARGADEMYAYSKRLESKELFKDRTKTGADIVRYADIALDLGVPDFAAMLYWHALIGIPPKEYGGRELLEYFLYCLEELGVKDLKASFKGDHVAEFAKIKAERIKLKHESRFYKVGAPPADAGVEKPKGDEPKK
jgi:tetratricopeptide (TPR) repeat protein